MCGRRVVPNFSPSYIKPAGKSHFWNRDRIFSSFISWNVCDKLVSFLIPNSNKPSALSIEVSILFSCKLILTSSASYFANISWVVLPSIILCIFFSITAVLSAPITVNRFFNFSSFFPRFRPVFWRYYLFGLEEIVFAQSRCNIQIYEATASSNGSYKLKSFGRPKCR